MLKVRKATSGDEQSIAEAHVASWKTTYAGIIPDSFLKTLSVEKRAALWTDEIRRMNEQEGQKVVFVCVDSNGKIQGFIAGGAEREAGSSYDGELYAIYLHQDQQRKGAGRSLTFELADWLSRHGYKKMRLWVLENNPSCRFYESIGGKRLPQTKEVDFGGKACLEIAYGWDDITALRNKLVKTR